MIGAAAVSAISKPTHSFELFAFGRLVFGVGCGLASTTLPAQGREEDREVVF